MSQEWVSVFRPDFEKGQGLIPVVVQDYETRRVLMLAYANRLAVSLSLSTGEAHYFSRSRQTLWHKGATSGAVQRIKDIRLDCDNDTLLYVVEQVGNACHTGEYTCFYRSLLVTSDYPHDAMVTTEGLVTLPIREAWVFPRRRGGERITDPSPGMVGWRETGIANKRTRVTYANGRWLTNREQRAAGGVSD